MIEREVDSPVLKEQLIGRNMREQGDMGHIRSSLGFNSLLLNELNFENTCFLMNVHFPL